MSYKINFAYHASLLEDEIARLRHSQSKLEQHEEWFERYLKVPCGVTGSVLWLARNHGSGVRFIELRTQVDNYLLLEFPASELPLITEQRIRDKAESEISRRWPKNPTYYDQHYTGSTEPEVA